MTQPSKKVSSVTRYVPDFAAYYTSHPSWGVFHVSLDDGNFEFGASDVRPDGSDLSELEERLAEVFSDLTPTQRQKLGRLAEQASRLPR